MGFVEIRLLQFEGPSGSSAPGRVNGIHKGQGVHSHLFGNFGAEPRPE